MLSDEDILNTNKHISDDEVKQDIKDTLKEIDELGIKIRERIRFIHNLNLLLRLRQKGEV